MYVFLHVCMYISVYVCIIRDVHPPEAMMHSPRFRFPPNFPQIFRICETISKFSREKFRFLSAKIYDDFFSHRPQFSNFPLLLQRFTCFLHTFCVFRFSPTLTMMHLCITQCTYWTPLHNGTTRGK